MRNKLVKEIRRSARTLFSDRPDVEYTTNVRGSTVLTDHCIKKVVKDTKVHINGTGHRL